MTLHANFRSLLAAGATATLVACGNGAPGIDNRIETTEQRIKRQKAEYDASPDIQGEDLRRRLNALGIEDGWMTPITEDRGIEILQLRVPAAAFDRLDHRALAKLMIDSRHRFEFADPRQVRIAALHHGAETHERDKARALKELAERGQIDTYPRYREGMAMQAFAPRLEAWCGYREEQALRVVDGAWVDYQPEMVDLAARDVDGRATASFDCVKRVVDATTELRRRFIGNRGRQGAIDY
ncbi:hypothetical protein H8M03_04420 [Sphingomonas sabuli]|uniref:Uncharacterized protein n=1 Tax=Sphingomonas sabuli TaxID=2764186 RepID=A0A7G9L4M9_9SPHN|nr:hypothetical protein [Sphingomonas sabuli]QNM83578.1 hypothetical protein H8M03_04420 [Sphingomonas sabuli]